MLNSQIQHFSSKLTEYKANLSEKRQKDQDLYETFFSGIMEQDACATI